MKNIIKSLVVVVAVAAVASVATWAYFTDQETVTSTISSAKLDIDLRGAAASGISIPLGTTQAFTGGMQPGIPSDRYEVQVYNQGWGVSTVPVKYRWTSALTSGDTALFNKLNVKVEDGNCDWLTSWPAGVAVVYNGPLSALNVTSESRLPGGLAPNITRCSWFTFELPSDADNSYQGMTANFNLVNDATQLNNPGWTQ